MQACEKCGTRFSYKQVLKSISWLYKPVTCQQCGTMSHVTAGSRFITALSAVWPMVMLQFLTMATWIRLLIFTILAVLSLLVVPYVARYRREPVHAVKKLKQP